VRPYSPIHGGPIGQQIEREPVSAHDSVSAAARLRFVAFGRRNPSAPAGGQWRNGTKVKANASKHKAMSYGRMAERATELEAEVAGRLSAAAAADGEEDKL
jgi:hypothetical protein